MCPVIKYLESILDIYLNIFDSGSEIKNIYVVATFTGCVMWNEREIEKTDNELMLEFQGCSRAAYNIIFNRYKKRLLNFVMRSFNVEKDLAEDIVQKTLIKVYEYKFKYKPVFEFTTWIYTITKNLSINEFNRKKGTGFDDENNRVELKTESFNKKIENEEENKIILDAIMKLKPTFREVVVMRYLEELSYEEIHEITGININTLKSNVKRGLEQIRVYLERCEIEK